MTQFSPCTRVVRRSRSPHASHTLGAHQEGPRGSSLAHGVMDSVFGVKGIPSISWCRWEDSVSNRGLLSEAMYIKRQLPDFISALRDVSARDNPSGGGQGDAHVTRSWGKMIGSWILLDGRGSSVGGLPGVTV